MGFLGRSAPVCRSGHNLYRNDSIIGAESGETDTGNGRTNIKSGSCLTQSVEEKIMSKEAIKLGKKRESLFINKVKEILPEGGNLNLCLTCGACSSGCPATGLEGMDPRKFLRMAALGMDEEIAKSDWPWMCTMCQRCIYVCPMKIDIPQLVYNARGLRPGKNAPRAFWVPATWPCATPAPAPWEREDDFVSWWRMFWKSTRRPSPNSPR
jgi:ferredoxin